MPAQFVNVIHASLQGPHRSMGRHRGRASRYEPHFSPFAGLPDEPTEQDWDDLATLLEPGEFVVLGREKLDPPASWSALDALPGVVMDGSGVVGQRRDDVVDLGPEDVAEVTELVELTRPGPWRERTIEFGGFVGVRDAGGRLVASAGRRINPGGWDEISAVCTDPSVRGQGLGAVVVNAVVAGIRERGNRPFLMAAAQNRPALHVYERLGFRTVGRPSFVRVQPRADSAGAGPPHSA